jgi:hypothetical protein
MEAEIQPSGCTALQVIFAQFLTNRKNEASVANISTYIASPEM